METGVHFKCLGGSCSCLLIPGAFQSPPCEACSVLPSVEVTISGCKDESNKIYIFPCTRFYIPFNILIPATFDLENLSKRRLQTSAFNVENIIGSLPQSCKRRMCNIWLAGRGCVYSSKVEPGTAGCSVLVLTGHYLKALPSSVPQTCLQ